MAFNYSPKTVTDGLVLYLDAANIKSYVSGSVVWNDLSKSQTLGSLVNGPTYNSLNGGSIVFDGIDDYVNIPNSNNIIFGSNDFTVSCWIKFPLASTGESSAWGPIISKGMTTAAPAGCWWLAQLSTLTSSIAFHAASGSGAYNMNINSGTITNGWHNVVVTKSGSVSNMYIDGVRVGGATTTVASLTSTSDLRICNTVGTVKYTQTSVSNVLLYNGKALTSTEAQQNFNTVKTRFGL
jgi:hypothetical protein